MTCTLRGGWRGPALLLLAGLVGAASLATAARAEDRRRDDRHDDHRDDRRDFHGRPGYYAPPPVAYEGPSYPAPPVVYGPGFGVALPGVNINIR